jgi:hypothetical protein
MAQTVPEVRPILTPLVGSTRDQTAIRIGESVRSGTWVGAAALQCWLAGRGDMLVPAHCVGVIVPQREVLTLRYWVKPRFQACRLAITLVVRQINEGHSSSERVYFRYPSGTGDEQYFAPGTRANPRPATFFVDRVAQSSDEFELAFDVGDDVDGSYIIESVAVEALPRTVLIEDNDLGAERLRFFPRQPIMEPTLSAQIVDRSFSLRSACRRSGLLQLSRPPETISGEFLAGAWFVDSSTPYDILASGVAVTPRLSAGTTGSADNEQTRWRVLARCSDGSTAGQVQMINTSNGTGASTPIAIPTGTTSWTWLPESDGEVFNCDVENNQTTYGYTSDTPDRHRFRLSRTAGSGVIELWSISLYESN